jgi:hypothetical protein
VADGMLPKIKFRLALVMTCPDCGELLNEIQVDRPCPRCGGSRRETNVPGCTAQVRSEVPWPSIAAGYTSPRPWQEKWQDVLSGVEAIEVAYATQEGLHIEEFRRDLEGFFKVCRELADWICRMPG